MILNYFKNKLINNMQYLLFPGQLINHSNNKSQQLLRCFADFWGQSPLECPKYGYELQDHLPKHDLHRWS